MQVAKWGNSLAIRLPAALVEQLQLKEGDEIDGSIGDAAWPATYQVGDTLILPVIAAQDLDAPLEMTLQDLIIGMPEAVAIAHLEERPARGYRVQEGCGRGARAAVVGREQHIGAKLVGPKTVDQVSFLRFLEVTAAGVPGAALRGGGPGRRGQETLAEVVALE